MDWDHDCWIRVYGGWYKQVRSPKFHPACIVSNKIDRLVAFGDPFYDFLDIIFECWHLTPMSLLYDLKVYFMKKSGLDYELKYSRSKNEWDINGRKLRITYSGTNLVDDLKLIDGLSYKFVKGTDEYDLDPDVILVTNQVGQLVEIYLSQEGYSDLPMNEFISKSLSGLLHDDELVRRSVKDINKVD